MANKRAKLDRQEEQGSHSIDKKIYVLRLDNIARKRNEKENNPSLRLFTLPLRFGGSAFSANQKLNI